MDVIGRPVMELPETLIDDLLTWRRLVNIGIKQRRKPEEEE